MLQVYQEAGLTGNFRLWRGVLQCEVAISIRDQSGFAQAYETYRDATASDHEIADFMSRCNKRKAA